MAKKEEKAMKKFAIFFAIFVFFLTINSNYSHAFLNYQWDEMRQILEKQLFAELKNTKCTVSTGKAGKDAYIRVDLPREMTLDEFCASIPVLNKNRQRSVNLIKLFNKISNSNLKRKILLIPLEVLERDKMGKVHIS